MTQLIGRAAPNQDLWRFVWLPAFLSILATGALAAPLRLLGFRAPEPIFPLVLAFSWAVTRPTIAGAFALFLLGVFQDLFWGCPLGFWGVCLMLAYGSALLARGLIVGQDTEVLFFWYFVAVTVAITTAYFLTLVGAGNPPNLVAVLWQFLATLALFPAALALRTGFSLSDLRLW